MRSAAVATLLLFAALPALAQEERDVGFAAQLGANCKERYEAYLLGPYPRVFALSPDRTRCASYAGGGGREPIEALALKSCGPTCTIVKRSPPVPPEAEFAPPEMFPAERDATSRHLGPDKAVGALIWSPGSTATNVIPSRFSTAPFVRAFNEAKWDVWRVDRTGPGEQTRRGGVLALNRGIDKVKAAGYRRIILAGQSAGGFLSIYLGARRTDIEAVIATAPATTGDLTDKKADVTIKALNEFDGLFGVRRNPRTRIAVALFSADEYEPSALQRATLMKRRAEEMGWPILLIDRPEGIYGHHAGQQVPFALRYRECLLRFVALPALDGGVHDCASIAKER
ncbi:MAG TPA: alpha/beta hydrolase [Reyranellaceae bacterium]|nr:alpha/beta hydrolase [Reyranellaceae bacterium]